MLELARKIQEFIESKIREMISISLAEIRAIEHVHGSEYRRNFLSGKLEAYNEILTIVKDWLKN